MELETLDKAPPVRPTRIPSPKKLSRTRMVCALGVAVIADGLQFALNGVGWFGLDQAIDVVAMLLTIWILGFHILLLPTFLLELLPVADMLPTWTGCVVAVIALKKRAERAAPPVVDV
jgi:hypothetical protein